MTQDEINSLIEKGELPLASPHLFSTHLNLMAKRSPLAEVKETFSLPVFRVPIEQLAMSIDSIANMLGRNKRFFCGILIPVPGSKFMLMAGQNSERGRAPHLWFVPRCLYDSEFEPDDTPIQYIDAFPQEISATVEDKEFDALFVSDEQPLYEFLEQQNFFMDAPDDQEQPGEAQANLAAIFLKHNLLELFKPGVMFNTVTKAQIILPGLIESLGKFLHEGRYRALIQKPELANEWANTICEAFHPEARNRASISDWLSPTAKLTGTTQPPLAYKKMAERGEIPSFEGSALDHWKRSMTEIETGMPVSMDDIWQQVSCLWDETESIPALKRTIDGYSLAQTNPTVEKSGFSLKYQLTKDLSPTPFFLEEEDAQDLVNEVNEVSGDEVNKLVTGRLSTYPPELVRKFVMRTANLLKETIQTKANEN